MVNDGSQNQDTNKPVRPTVKLFPTEPTDGQMPEDRNAADVVDDEEVHDEFAGKLRKGPVEPTTAARDYHSATGHAVFRSWCSDCVQGRGRANPHVSHDHGEDSVPVLG